MVEGAEEELAVARWGDDFIVDEDRGVVALGGAEGDEDAAKFAYTTVGVTLLSGSHPIPA